MTRLEQALQQSKKPLKSLISKTIELYDTALSMPFDLSEYEKVLVEVNSAWQEVEDTLNQVGSTDCSNEEIVN